MLCRNLRTPSIWLVTLTPYAVLLRHAAADSALLDRGMMLDATEAVRAWAAALIGGSPLQMG